MTYHLKGALTLAQLRGTAQFESTIGHGIYSRMRGFMVRLQFRKIDGDEWRLTGFSWRTACKLESRYPIS